MCAETVRGVYLNDVAGRQRVLVSGLMTSIYMTVTWQTLAMRKMHVQRILGVKLSERGASRT